MPRKLKTYITNLGFFELAIAAPSMKAALEAWGMAHNSFQQGFAKETHDQSIVTAATAKPGIVLKRAIGSKGAFREDADLPTHLPNIKPPKLEKAKAAKLRKAEKKEKPKAKHDPKAERAAILSFQKAKTARDKKRAEEEKRLEAARQAKRRELDKAQAALEDAREEHQTAMAAIEREREKLDQRADKETERWNAQHKKLSTAIEKAETG